MSTSLYRPSRRLFLASAALGAAGLYAPGAFAEQLLRTPAMTEGPFYPTKLPLDTDNDLLVINDSLTPAVGQVTHLTGKVLTAAGSPVNNATVEIWQCDANQVYLHPRDSGPKAGQMDKNFQGFGRFQTGTDGGYRFRTIKPVAYPGRPAPHIHVKVKRGGATLLTTQFFVTGHAGNRQDGVVQGADPLDRELLMVDFKPLPGSTAGELTADFLIVLGTTPDEGRPARKG